MKHKCVPVRRYQRFRFGRWEDVCKHYRSNAQSVSEVYQGG